MGGTRLVVLAVGLAAGAVTAVNGAGVAHAGELGWQPVSYSVAVGASNGHLMAHMWLGTGVRYKERPRTGVFVLAGLEVDFRDGPEEPPKAASVVKAARPVDTGGTELWTVIRVGRGIYTKRGFVPGAAFYTLGGVRVAGPDERPTFRVGGGISFPAVIVVAKLGIPTMLESGMDAGGDGHRRYFVRVGWNF